MALLRRGELSAAHALGQAALSEIEQSGSTIHKAVINAEMAVLASLSAKRQEAEEQIKTGLRRMARVAPPAPSYLEGYANLLLACLSLFQESRTASERKQSERYLKEALFQMCRFALVFPIGWPRALFGVGRYLWLCGQPRLALTMLRQSLERASRFDMPYDVALCQLWLARLGSSASGSRHMPRSEARAHLENARQLFRELGAKRELGETEALLHGF